MNAATLIPLAITVILGPQLTVAVLLLMKPDPVKKSLAFILGINLGIVILTFLMYQLGQTVHLPATPAWAREALKIALTVLLVVLGIRQYFSRNTLTKQPKWMTVLDKSSILSCFFLGLIMVLIFPADIGAAVNMAGILTTKHLAFNTAIPFFICVTIMIATPLCLYWILGKNGPVIIQKVNAWINTHGWVVNEIVYGFFLILIWT